MTVARLFGIALIALGVACYPRGSRQGLHGLLAYNVLVAVYLASAGFGGVGGVLLWPAVALHAVLSIALAMTMRG